MIETIVAEDSDTIRKIARETFAFDPEATDTVNLFIETGSVRVIGAKENDTFLGRLNLYQPPVREQEIADILPDASSIVGLFVNPEQRRRGIGQLLLNAAEIETKTQGFSRICLGVKVENTAARKLYETSGYIYMEKNYETCWDEPDENGEMKQKCVEAILMVKNL